MRSETRPLESGRPRKRRNTFHSPLPLVVIFCLPFITWSGCGGASPAEWESGGGAPYRYLPRAALGNTTVSTVAGDVTVRCPMGWMETADPKNAPSILLWLVREDYGASIAFTAMKMDPSLYRAVRKDGLRAVAKVSMGLKKGNAGDSIRIIRQPEFFHLNGRDFAAYEYSAESGASIVRVVVFDTGSRFMECTAVSADKLPASDEVTTLFETQQSVLSSMVVR